MSFCQLGSKGQFTYSTRDKLGQGGMSYIYSAKLFKRFPVAIKKIKQNSNSLLSRNKDFQKNMRLLTEIENENILQTMQVLLYDNQYHIVTERCIENKTLRDLIPKTGMNCEEAFQYAHQLVKGLYYLHHLFPKRQKSLLHLDIKPENIFIGEDKKLKIGDFDLCMVVDKINMYKAIHPQNGWTIQYADPYTIKNQKLSAKYDIWSLGCVFYEMLFGIKLNQAKKKRDIQMLIDKYIKQGLKNLPLLKGKYSQFFQNILKKMLIAEESLRIDTQTLYRQFQLKINPNLIFDKPKQPSVFRPSRLLPQHNNLPQLKNQNPNPQIKQNEKYPSKNKQYKVVRRQISNPKIKMISFQVATNVQEVQKYGQTSFGNAQEIQQIQRQKYNSQGVKYFRDQGKKFKLVKEIYTQIRDSKIKKNYPISSCYKDFLLLLLVGLLCQQSAYLINILSSQNEIIINKEVFSLVESPYNKYFISQKVKFVNELEKLYHQNEINYADHYKEFIAHKNENLFNDLVRVIPYLRQIIIPKVARPYIGMKPNQYRRSLVQFLTSQFSSPTITTLNTPQIKRQSYLLMNKLNKIAKLHFELINTKENLSIFEEVKILENKSTEELYDGKKYS